MALDTSEIYSGASSDNGILIAHYYLVGDTVLRILLIHLKTLMMMRTTTTNMESKFDGRVIKDVLWGT